MGRFNGAKLRQEARPNEGKEKEQLVFLSFFHPPPSFSIAKRRWRHPNPHQHLGGNSLQQNQTTPGGRYRSIDFEWLRLRCAILFISLNKAVISRSMNGPPTTTQNGGLRRFFSLFFCGAHLSFFWCETIDNSIFGPAVTFLHHDGHGCRQ